ncbi:MAG TPA: type II toxin-antitoxin system VapB family antitoxin [Turneriella sp.]|nr:type II toxin-antitoxin system VapB family antitoxin [Turneriella sp.]
MATNLAIDDKLLNEALKVGHFKSKKDTVNTALREFIQKRRQKDILNLFGAIDFDEKYDYKKARNRT